MGEVRKDALRLSFNRKLKLEFHGTKVLDASTGPFWCFCSAQHVEPEMESLYYWTCSKQK